ncbi:MAG: M28 family peptidase [Chloroflexota bacterium]|nr:M28 family peptidase [Chloroflexota bacterium]
MLETTMCNAIDADRMMRDVAFLSTLQRHAGTDDEARAFRYIADQCRAAGIKDVREYAFDAFLSFPVKGTLTIAGIGPVKTKTRAFATSTNGEEASGEIVFVPTKGGTALFSGDGSHDYDDIDVRGKIVISDRGRPDTILAAGRAGALCHIHYWASDEDAIHEQITTTIWGTPTPDTIGRLPIIPSLGVTRNDGLRIAAAAKGGGLRGTFSTVVQTEWRRVPIVVAHIPGQCSDDFAFANGHVDSWSHGTTDNATGNAACLELARVAWQSRDELARGVRVAWWTGHSQGRYAGSAWYADNFWEDLHAHAIININIDSPGARGATRYDVVTMGAETERFGTEVIRELTGQHAEAERPTRAGDQSFWGPGVPSLYMLLSNLPKEQWAAVGGCGMNWWWHTEADTVETADRDVLALDTRIYAATLARFCGGPVLPFTLADAAREIDDLLADYERQAAGRFDLAPARARAADAIHAAEGLDARAHALVEANVSPDDPESRTVVAAQMAVTRALVPLRYTAGNRFDHDPAMPAPALQLLRDLPLLATLPPESDEARFLTTALIRKRNAVCAALREATLATET